MAKELEPIEKVQSRVRRARKRLGMTQKEFATHVGVSVVTAQKWEQGLSRPKSKEHDATIRAALKRPRVPADT